MHCKVSEAGTILWWLVLAAFRARGPGQSTPARQTLTNDARLSHSEMKHLVSGWADDSDPEQIRVSLGGSVMRVSSHHLWGG